MAQALEEASREDLDALKDLLKNIQEDSIILHWVLGNYKIYKDHEELAQIIAQVVVHASQLQKEQREGDTMFLLQGLIKKEEAPRFHALIDHAIHNDNYREALYAFEEAWIEAGEKELGAFFLDGMNKIVEIIENQGVSNDKVA